MISFKKSIKYFFFISNHKKHLIIKTCSRGRIVGLLALFLSFFLSFTNSQVIHHYMIMWTLTKGKPRVDKRFCGGLRRVTKSSREERRHSCKKQEAQAPQRTGCNGNYVHLNWLWTSTIKYRNFFPPITFAYFRYYLSSL